MQNNLNLEGENHEAPLDLKFTQIKINFKSFF